MSETAEQQRTRILNANPDTHPADYDLAVTLGYRPERWDGMYRLIREPFTFINGYAIIRESAKTYGTKTDSHGGVRLRVRCVKAPA